MSELKFNSRRPTIVTRHGAVACGQYLAGQVGLDILRAGGNAADAAVAVAAGMAVTQTCNTGLGGDIFCLFYDAKTKKVRGLNGSGRAPAALTLERVKKDGFGPNKTIPDQHGLSVTVPGAAAGWVDTIETFGSGKLTMEQILRPVIDMAETGFPISEIAANAWSRGARLFTMPGNIYGSDLLIDGRSPKMGEIFRNPHLAQTIKAIATDGKKGYYEGRIARAIAEADQRCGGVMTEEDLKNHTSTFIKPISTAYKGVRLWETPPNGQGIVALMTLNLLKEFNLEEMHHNSVEYLHTLIETMRLCFKDSCAYVADPAHVSVPVEQLLSDQYAHRRSALINPNKAIIDACCGDPTSQSKDTVYFTTADKDGNACSFIASNFKGFGTGIVPEGCGFTLQDRGLNFSLEANHPNVIAPNKRPYHTIIPAMLTDDETGSAMHATVSGSAASMGLGLLTCHLANEQGRKVKVRCIPGDLLASYGVMGGFMQPQGHIQVLMNMLHFGMTPQEALDQPRFCIVGPGPHNNDDVIYLEDGMPEVIYRGLKEKGHKLQGPVKGYDRDLFGRGHVITKGSWWLAEDNNKLVKDQSSWWIGSDPRTDGHALGY